MVPIKALLTGLLGVSACMADISGIVTDTGATPIAGAVVQLEKGGQTATTGTDGSFKLSASTGILPGNGKLLPKGLSAGITDNLMTLTIAERSAVEIATFDLNGKALSTVRKTLDAGSHSIELPQRGSGIYLYKVKSGNREFVLKGNSVGRAASGSGVSTQGLSSNSLAKQAKVAVAINDVIAATKDGYLNYRCVQYNFDTSGIAIKMLASAGTVTDTDGNVYQTVRIGGQVWTVENLRVTRYRDGSAISLDTSTATWASDNVATTPMFCYYSNMTNADSIKKYGALYNWYVVSPANLKKIAPAGWHMPTESEWEIMQRYLVMHDYNYDGTTDTTTTNKIAMALAAQMDWSSSKGAGLPGNNLTKNNSSGFSALPGGGRKGSSTVFIPGGTFWAKDSTGYWWSATGTDVSSTWISLYYGNNDLSISGINFKNYGFSVRLVRDSI
jgi:uncharacterized protein (TIGR02145 family)